MIVSRAKYDRLLRMYQGERRRREEAEQKFNEQATAAEKLRGLVEQDRDQRPATPVSYPVPPSEVVRLRQELARSNKAREALDAQCLELQRINEQLYRQDYDRAHAGDGAA